MSGAARFAKKTNSPLFAQVRSVARGQRLNRRCTTRMPTMGSTPRFAKDRVIQAAHPFMSARADVSSHPFYDSPGPPTRTWPDATPRPRTAPQTKERPPPVEVPYTPASRGYAGESPYAAIEVGTSTVDSRTNRLQILPDTALAKERNGRLELTLTLALALTLTRSRSRTRTRTRR